MEKTESAPGERARPRLADATIRQTERRDAAYRAAWEEIEGRMVEMPRAAGRDDGSAPPPPPLTTIRVGGANDG